MTRQPNSGCAKRSVIVVPVQRMETTPPATPVVRSWAVGAGGAGDAGLVLALGAGVPVGVGVIAGGGGLTAAGGFGDDVGLGVTVG